MAVKDFMLLRLNLWVDEGRIRNAGSPAPTPLIYSGHPCLYLSFSLSLSSLKHCFIIVVDRVADPEGADPDPNPTFEGKKPESGSGSDCV